MKSRGSGFIVMLIPFTALFYCHFMVSIYTRKTYTQQNLLFYHLLTPKPLKQAPRVFNDWFFTSYADNDSHLQRSEIVFTGIQKSGIRIAEDKLNAYIGACPVSRETMSTVVEEKYKKYDTKAIYYESNEWKKGHQNC